SISTQSDTNRFPWIKPGNSPLNTCNRIASSLPPIPGHTHPAYNPGTCTWDIAWCYTEKSCSLTQESKATQ
ncbi:MAG: hypothetical protein ACLU30_15770, partial [Odoribacter splanchnicus]